MCMFRAYAAPLQVWAGNPAKMLRKLEEEEAGFIAQAANDYAALAAVHAVENGKSMEEILVRPLPSQLFIAHKVGEKADMKDSVSARVRRRGRLTECMHNTNTTFTGLGCYSRFYLHLWKIAREQIRSTLLNALIIATGEQCVGVLFPS